MKYQPLEVPLKFMVYIMMRY